ncbi:MAG TPA: hypothetical protein VFV58_39210 [Blastocatellia bacterium]|jgi:hypothetical protein|nr:hypothetical protein [Blastocatellia bacterium]
MPATNRIYLQVDFNSQSASQDIDKLNKQMGALGPTGEKAGEQASKGINSIGISVEGVTNDLGRMANAFAALGVAKAVKEMIGLGDQLNRIQRGFQNMAEGGGEVFKQLHEMALATGVNFDEAVTGLQRLVQQGVPMKELPRIFENWNNQLAKVGVSVNELPKVFDLLAKAMARPGVTMKALVSLATETGLPVFAKLMETKGLDRFGTEKFLKPFSGPEFVAAVTTLAGMETHGAAAAAAIEDLERKENVLKTTTGALAQSFDKGFGPSLSKTLDFLILLVGTLDDLIKALGRLPQAVKDALFYMTALAGVIFSIGSFVKLLTFGFAGFRGFFGALRAGVGAAIGIGAGAAEITTLGTLTLEVGKAAVKTGAAAAEAGAAAASAGAASGEAAAAAGVAAARAGGAAAVAGSAVGGGAAVAGGGLGIGGAVAGGAAGSQIGTWFSRMFGGGRITTLMNPGTLSLEGLAAAGGGEVAGITGTAIGAGGLSAGWIGALTAGVVALVVGGIYSYITSSAAREAAKTGAMMGFGQGGGPGQGLVTGLIGSFVTGVYGESAAAQAREEIRRERAKAPAGAGAAAPAGETEEERLQRELRARFNSEKMKQQVEEAKRAVLEARAELARVGKEPIQALPLEFQADVSKVEKNDEAIAQYRIRLGIRIDTELKKLEEERKKEALKNAEEMARAGRQLAISQAELIYGDETFAGKQKIAEARAQAYEDDLNAVKQVEQDKIDVRTAAAAEGAFNARLIELDTSKMTNAQIAQAYKEMNAESVRIYAEGNQDKADIAARYDRIIARHRVDTERESQALMLEFAKKRIEEEANLTIQSLARASAYNVAKLELQRPRNLQERVQQIQNIQDEQIEFIKKQTQIQKDANNAYLEEYAAKHKDAETVVDEMRSTTRRQNEALDIQSSQRTQEARFAAWKATDDAILQSQRDMYGDLLSFTDQFWNALTDRTHSVWQNIGNAIKGAFTNALKGFVTSRIAGTLQETFGGGHVEFTGSWLDRLLGRRPYFEGSKAPIPAFQGLENASTNLNFSAVLLIQAGQDLAMAASGLAAAANRQMLAGGYTPGGPGMLAGPGGIGGAAQGDAQRMIEETFGDLPTRALPSLLSTSGIYTANDQIANLPTRSLPSVYATSAGPSILGARTSRLGGFLGSLKKVWSGIKGSFDIGKPIGGVDWSQATIWQKAGAILKSTGMANIMALAGGALIMGGLGAKTGAGQLTQTAIGGALLGASVGSQIAKNLPGLGFGMGKGAIAGTGAGLIAFGMKRGGVTGLGSSILGGAMLGATIGSIIPGVGTLIGAAVGAAAGAVAGTIRMLVPGFLSQVRDRIFQAYHVIIPDQGVLQSIADIINQKYGGKISTGIYSTEVQEIVRAYAISSGQTHAALPRPMYPATFAQSATGGLQLQPVYSSGQLVASPYTGATTTQYAQALTPQPPLYLQLNPGQANALLEGRVVNAIASNPGAIGAANTTAAVTGTNRTRQSSALLEPLTVTR